MLRLSVVGNAMVVARGAWGVGNNGVTSTSSFPSMTMTGAAQDLMVGSSGRRAEGEAQVTVRGVVGTSVKGTFYFVLDQVSEELFVCRSVSWVTNNRFLLLKHTISAWFTILISCRHPIQVRAGLLL